MFNETSNLRYQLSEWHGQYEEQYYGPFPGEASEAEEHFRNSSEKLQFDQPPPDMNEGNDSSHWEAGAGSSFPPPNARRGMFEEPPGSDTEDEGGQSAKEAEAVRIDTWPRPAIFTRWIMGIFDASVAASPRPRLAFKWLSQVSHADANFDNLVANRYQGHPFATLTIGLFRSDGVLMTRRIDLFYGLNIVISRQIQKER